MNNAQYLVAMSKLAPEFAASISKLGNDLWTEKGFQRLQNLPGTEDRTTRFFDLCLLIGMQRVDHAKYTDVLQDIGLEKHYKMDLGTYMQRNRVKRIRNNNPLFLGSDGKGLKNGDSIDPFVVKKPEIKQTYFGENNVFYQTHFTWQEFDLKGAFINAGSGIDELLSAVYEMIDLDRVEVRFGLFFEILGKAIQSTEYPMQDTQKLTLTSWTDGAPTDAEIRELIEILKNVEEQLSLTPTVEAFNAGKAPNKCKMSDLVLMCRPGIKSKIESVMAYVYGPEYLQFPIKIQPVERFCSLKYYAPDDTSHTTELKPVKDANGEWTGEYSENGSVEDADKYLPGECETVDELADVLCVLAEVGLIFWLDQHPLKTGSIYNPAGDYVNTWFNENGNGIFYNDEKNLITISKPSA